MKRVRVMLVILVMSLVCTYFIPFAGAEGGYLWMVDAPSGVNVRDAKKDGNIIGCIRKGEIFRVVEEDNYWIGTIYGEDGQIGYIYKSNCHIAHAEEIEEWEKRKKAGIKVTNEDAFYIGTIKQDCRVYKQANGKVIGELKADDVVYIRQLGQYWYKIIWNNKEIGYVQTKNVKLTDINVPGDGEIKILIDQKYGYTTHLVREEPNFEANKLATLSGKPYVRVIDEESDDTFALVAYDSYGNVGYVQKRLLHPTTFFSND